MPTLTSLLFILQISIISVAPAYASHSISLATTKASNRAVTAVLVEVIQTKETTSEVCLALIAKGADVNTKDNYGYSPLILAAGNSLADVCLALIDCGADVNALDQSGWTPLLYAAYKGLADVCITLINKGANVDAKDIEGNTPLTGAAYNDHSDVCILLLRHMLFKQLLAADPDGGDITTRKIRMRCAILTLKKTAMSKDLIPLILKSKPLMHDYTACRYDTYCCRLRLNEYHHAITKDQLSNLLGQGNVDALKAALQDACNTCRGNNPALKNLLDPVDFDQHFDGLFLKPLKPTMGE